MQQGLANKSDVFRSVRDELDSPFFRRNGLLFLPPNQIERVTGELTKARPVIGELVRDPSLRGLAQVLTGILGYAKQGYISLDDGATAKSGCRHS